MPAVDSPLAGGLDIEELQALVGPIVHHPAAAGLQLTIYDPTADPDRSGARLSSPCCTGCSAPPPTHAARALPRPAGLTNGRRTTAGQDSTAAGKRHPPSS